MEFNLKKLENFWFYYKKHLLIGLAVLLVTGYLAFQDAGTKDADYHIGLICSTAYTEEMLAQLEEEFTACGQDLNSDGNILVQIHTYFVDLADESADAGVRNAEVVAALDADLIGHVSGIFLLDDVQTFQTVTNGLLSDTVIPFKNGLFLAPRRDAGTEYLILAQQYS